MTAVAALTAANAVRWEKAKLTRAAEFTPVAKRLVAAKTRYVAIEARTSVPWFVIAVIHQRESAQRWDRSIAQGDPWNKVSTHVPKGRGPFASFEDAAFDALMNCAPFAGKWTDWSAGGTLTLLEHYNGLGYFKKGKPSPYIWSGTDQYSRGKYVADGVYDPNAVDKQLGCAGLLMAMQKLDRSVSFDGADDASADDDVASDSSAVPPSTPTAPKDAPPNVQPVDPTVDGDPVLLDVQQRLKARRYLPGVLDGRWGSGTSGALGGFMNDRGLRLHLPTSLAEFHEIADEVRAELLEAENENWFRPVSEARANADPKTVKELAPEVVPAKRNFIVTAWGSVLAFLSAAWETISGYVSQAWDFFTDHKDVVDDHPGIMDTVWSYVTAVPSGVWLMAGGGVLAFIAYNSWRAVKTSTQAVQNGERQ